VAAVASGTGGVSRTANPFPTFASASSTDGILPAAAAGGLERPTGIRDTGKQQGTDGVNKENKSGNGRPLGRPLFDPTQLTATVRSKLMKRPTN